MNENHFGKDEPPFFGSIDAWCSFLTDGTSASSHFVVQFCWESANTLGLMVVVKYNACSSVRIDWDGHYYWLSNCPLRYLEIGLSYFAATFFFFLCVTIYILYEYESHWVCFYWCPLNSSFQCRAPDARYSFFKKILSLVFINLQLLFYTNRILCIKFVSFWVWGALSGFFFIVVFVYFPFLKS